MTWNLLFPVIPIAHSPVFPLVDGVTGTLLSLISHCSFPDKATLVHLS